MRTIQVFILSVAVLVSASCAAADVGTRQEAIEMVKRVKALADREGIEATVQAINSQRPDFEIKDLYPFIFTLDGICIAHGANVKMVGKAWITTKDQDGNYLIKMMADLAASAEAKGWVNYKWPHPITHKIEDKSAYIEKLGDNYFVGVGIYPGT